MYGFFSQKAYGFITRSHPTDWKLRAPPISDHLFVETALEKLQQEQTQVRRHTTSIHLVLYVMHMTTGRKDDPCLPVGMKKKVSSSYGKKENSGHTSGFSQGCRTSPSHMCRNASRCPPSMSQPSQHAHSPPLSSQGCPGAPHDQHTSSSSRSTEETPREMYHKQLGSSKCCPIQNKHESKFVPYSSYPGP